jgi:glycerol-3-phosphate dehydrogenase (NAD(P)+)
MSKIAVIGAGSWGTALAILLRNKGCKISLWARNPEFAQELQDTKENRKYLPGVKFPEGILVSPDLEETVQNSNIVLLVVPSKAVRSTAKALSNIIKENQVIVNAAKGIERESLKLMSQVISEEIPHLSERIVALSGPNHAEEVSRGMPSATVVAAKDLHIARYVQEAFISPTFRVYRNDDLLGVEIAGALKNVIAIDAGASDGLGFGDNTKAALLTRGLAEIGRIGVAMGANPLTFAGLAGIGDLIATCTSTHSRNRMVGYELAKGRSLEEILSGMSMVAEGVGTTEAAVGLAKKYGIEVPLISATYNVLFNKQNLRESVLGLMLRDPKHEIDESEEYIYV